MVYVQRSDSRCNYSIARIMVAVVSVLALILLIVVIVQAAKPDKAPVWEPRVHTPPLGPYTTELCKQYTNFNYTQPDIS